MASLQCLEACKGEAMARVKILNNGRNASDRGGARALPSFGGTKRSVFSTNAQSWFASDVPDGVLGPLRRTQHTWQ